MTFKLEMTMKLIKASDATETRRFPDRPYPYSIEEKTRYLIVLPAISEEEHENFRGYAVKKDGITINNKIFDTLTGPFHESLSEQFYFMPLWTYHKPSGLTLEQGSQEIKDQVLKDFEMTGVRRQLVYVPGETTYLVAVHKFNGRISVDFCLYFGLRDYLEITTQNDKKFLQIIEQLMIEGQSQAVLPKIAYPSLKSCNSGLHKNERVTTMSKNIHPVTIAKTQYGGIYEGAKWISTNMNVCDIPTDALMMISFLENISKL